MLTFLMGSVTDILNYNRDCAYANELPVAVEDLEVGKRGSTAQGAEGPLGGGGGIILTGRFSGIRNQIGHV